MVESGRSGGDVASFHGNAGEATDVGDVKVAKAKGTNAYPVAEIVTGRSGLKDKPVMLRGKVVKVTVEVMGKGSTSATV